MLKSEIIKKKIKELQKEREELIKHLKPVPRGRYEKELIGYRVHFTGGSLFDAVKRTEYSPENAKYRNVLKYNGKKISGEKLKEMRSAAITDNEPKQKRIEEIDKLLPILESKLIEVKASELLNLSEDETNSKQNKENKINLSEHGELKKFIEDFIKSKEFLDLNIPKHQTLKANQKLAIEKILVENFSNYDLNLASFYTILSKLDYSKSRKK